MDLKISSQIQEKLKEKHNVSLQELFECFANRAGKFFTDSRDDHKTNPPTYWFISETDKGRVLKVVFVRYPDFYAIKSAYEPKDGSDALYKELNSRS